VKLAGLGALALLTGCASTSPKAGYAAVASLVEQRGGMAPHWDQHTPEDAEVADRVKALVGKPLTPEAAVELALLENRGLQAVYESVGIAQAELVQAGLLANPSLGASVGIPFAGSSSTAVQGSLAEDFLRIFTIPLRKRFAEHALRAAELRVGSAVMQMQADVRGQFLSFQAAQQTVELLRTIVGADAASAELAKRQSAAGNISELTYATRAALYQTERVELARAEAALLESREALNRLMGLWGADTRWQVSATLPDLPKEELELGHIESRAIANRLDLAAAKEDAASLARAFSLASGTRFIPLLDLGVSAERDSEGNQTIGPTAQVELPLFDQHQAELARLAAQFREARDRQLELAVEIRSQVRTQRNRLVTARQVVEHYRQVVLPLRERIVQLSQEHYNGMLLGVYGLILAKQDEITAYREYIDAVRDYWLARVELERATGTRFPQSTSPSTSTLPAEAPARTAARL